MIRRGTHAAGRFVTAALIALAGAALAYAAAGRYGGPEPGALLAQAPGAAGASTGVFTEDQAQRGQAVFQGSCSGCHGGNLQGGMGPRLSPLGGHWQGSTLGALYRFVSANMPMSAPGSLEPQQYADVIAYVLSHNGFPAGEAELAPDDAALEAFVIDAPPTE